MIGIKNFHRSLFLINTRTVIVITYVPQNPRVRDPFIGTWKYPFGKIHLEISIVKIHRKDPFMGTRTRTYQNIYRPDIQYNPKSNSKKPHLLELILLKCFYAT